jgi:hypothetical protein
MGLWWTKRTGQFYSELSSTVSEKEFVQINLVIQRYEVWYYHLWNQRLPYTDPMGCLEIIKDNEVVLPALVILTEKFL